jgi:hypothetical protein
MRYPLSRSYRVNLPSSFNIILSSALVYSTNPPVLVSGTVYTCGLFPGSSSRLTQSIKNEQLTTFVTSHRSRNINLVPIDYGFRPALINIGQEPLDFRRQSLSLCLTLLMSAFSLPIPPAALASLPSQAYGTLRYRATYVAPVASVYSLSPVTFSAQDDLNLDQ